MPNGRSPYALESPWFGVGAGIGGAMAAYFKAKRGKKEIEIEDFGKVFSQATLTGNKEVLALAVAENPEAAEEFRKRTGIDVFQMTIPEVEMPEVMQMRPGPPEAAEPGTQPLPPTPPMPTGVPGTTPQMPEMPPAALTPPQPGVPSPIPWPVEPQGIQARATQEQIAGGAKPPGAIPPEPSPLSLITKDYKAIGTTMESLPSQRHKEAFLQAIEPHMPQGFPTEVTGPAAEPPTPREIELMNKLYDMSPEERETWRTTRVAPMRAPRQPETPEMRMTITEFLRAYPNASDEEWGAFLESEGATIPSRAPRIQSDENTQVSLFNRSFEIAMLTGESQPEVYAQLVANTYKSEDYLVEKKKADEIGILRMMLMDAYRLGNEKEAEKMMERMSALTGIPYKKKGKWWEQVLDMLRGTQQYSAPGTPELEEKSDFEREFERR